MAPLGMLCREPVAYSAIRGFATPVVVSGMLLDPTRFALFTGAALVLIVTPGPAVLYITARSMSQGVRAGLVSVLAIETGNCVHALAASLGLAALLASSPLAFAAVRLLGAGYLVFLAIRKLAGRTKGDPARLDGSPAPTLRKVYLEGVAVSVLNPKTALFFLAFLPQFVSPARGRLTAQMLLLGASFVSLAALSDAAYAFLSGSAGRWLRTHPGFVRGERYVSATVYAGLGLAAALSAAPAGSAPVSAP